MIGTFLGHRRTLAGGLVACVLAAGVPAVLGTSVDPTSVDFVGGTAWLVSEVQDGFVRINGASGKLDASVPAGDEVGTAAGAAISQEHNTVLVNVGGEIRGLDLANLNWGASTSAAPESALVVGDDLAWLVAPDGVVRELNPTTLAERGKVDLGGTPGQAVVAEDNLVVPLDDGTVRVIDGHEQVGELEVGRPTDQLHVTSLGKRVIALNQTVGRVFRVDAEHAKILGKADVNLPEGELAVPTELPRGPLWLLARRSGDLVRISTQTGQAETMRVDPSMVTPRGDVLGPASADGTVYLVDRSAREVVLFDTVTRQRGSRPFPESITDPTRVELVVEGGYVYVNDVAGSVVTVFNDGQPTDIDKYENDGVPGTDPPPPGDEAPPDPGQPPPPGEGDPAPPPPPATDPPAAPTAVAAVAGNASATVSWTHGAGTTPPTAYRVSYEGRRDPIEMSGDTSSVRIDDLRNGDNYAFEVWAVNDYGESDRVLSNTVKPNDEVPGTPSNVTATPGNTDARVSWDAADGRGNDITSYIVTAQPGGRTATVDGGTTSVTVTGLTNDTAYTFQVVAVNDRGIQGQASPSSAAVTPYGPPSALANLRASSGDGSVDLTWDASTSRAAVTYTIVSNRAIDGQTQWTTTSTSWSQDGLSNGVAYTLTVTPQNDHGNGGAGRATVTPGRAATISNVVATRSGGDRRFEVTFNYDDGGLQLAGCEVSGAGSVQQATCNGGTGRATFDVGSYNTPYTFTASVRNSRNTAGPASGSASGRSAAKPLTVRSDAANWDGSCTWAPHLGGTPNTRPYFRSANHTCPEWDPVEHRPIGYLPVGTGVRALCGVQGERVEDDNLDGTTLWFSIEGYGYMPAIYFTTWNSGAGDGLPGC